MARITSRPLSPELAAPGLTAAANPVDVGGSTAGSKLADVSGWKKEAWGYFDTVGELRFTIGWMANSMARISLYAADIDPATGRPTETPTENAAAAQIVTDIAGGPAGKAAMLKKLTPQLTVPGEGWIAVIVRTAQSGKVEEWHVLSADEIQTRGARITLQLEDGTDHAFNPSTDILTRVHVPHPRKSRQSDSPVLAALPVLREITRTTAAIDGAGKSRLAGNGMLLLPSEISMPVTEAPKADPDAPGLPGGQPQTTEKSVSAQDVMNQIGQVMTTAISDPSSAASMVPIVLKASGEHLDKIRHISFESEVTETNLDTRDRAIRRLSLSLDVPPEVLMGLGDSTHWNAELVDDSTLNNHLAPMMTVICDALTEAILKPLLVSHGQDPTGVVVWFDTSDLTKKTDRSDDAQAAYDAGAINANTYRRELGFTDDDAPVTNTSERTPDEVKAANKQLATDIVRGAPSTLPMLAHILELPPPPGGWGGTGQSTDAPPEEETE